MLLGKFSLTKSKQYFKQNSAIHFGELSKPGKLMFLAFLCPRCSSSRSACSTQVLEFLIWESPLDPAWATGTGVLDCKVTLSSSHEWESWICSPLLDRPLDQNKIFYSLTFPSSILSFLDSSTPDLLSERIKVI